MFGKNIRELKAEVAQLTDALELETQRAAKWRTAAAEASEDAWGKYNKLKEELAEALLRCSQLELDLQEDSEQAFNDMLDLEAELTRTKIEARTELVRRLVNPGDTVYFKDEDATRSGTVNEVNHTYLLVHEGPEDAHYNLPFESVCRVVKSFDLDPE